MTFKTRSQSSILRLAALISTNVAVVGSPSHCEVILSIELSTHKVGPQEMSSAIPVQFNVSASSGPRRVSALLDRPSHSRWLLVFAHGAGAGMRHAFMNAASAELVRRCVATFRYQFPYMEVGGGRPDPPSLLVATVRAAVDIAQDLARDLPLLAGGKSLGARMTSTAASQEKLPSVRGLVFFGFPLHPSGDPSVLRAKHLESVHLPMLFLQGTRDKLAEPSLLAPVCEGLQARALVHWIQDADHSFHVPKRSGRTDEDVLRELGETVEKWIGELR